ncbi:MerR family transcriptional regulator [Ruminococcaceae bacterium OttesenSCG-928-I18]|nr:MerR family transcriptional regulator [Ruminococcaceae bacterium OttesenSCG-928-I18]
MQSTFKIGELAKLYGIGTDAIRYYEEQGLITPQRGENGYRRYSIRDIWRMNVIRDLRGLGFPLERIRAYLEERSVESTLQLLDEELDAIDERIVQLGRQRANVQSRIKTIQNSQTRPFGVVETLSLPTRFCHEIAQPFTTDEEMDVLIKQLLNQGRERLYIIGSAGIGARVKLRPDGKGRAEGYASAFILDDEGPVALPGGQYLALRYTGSTRQTAQYLSAMLRQAEVQGLRPAEDALEFVWIDIHEASDISEHITELQLRVE